MKKNRAFTLIELLVVVSIIALLVAILMPALGKAREQAKATLCKTNMKSAHMASVMYADSNDDNFPNPKSCFYASFNPFPANYKQNGKPAETSFTSSSAILYRWCNPQMDLTKGPEYGGLLFKYLSEPDVLVCPTFESHSRTLATQINLWGSTVKLSSITYHLNYTISMNAYLGSILNVSEGVSKSSMQKVSGVRRAAETFIFAEENPMLTTPPIAEAALNDTFLVVLRDDRAEQVVKAGIRSYKGPFIDAIGGLHEGGLRNLSKGKANLAFVDGHVDFEAPADSFYLAWPKK